MKSRFFTPKNMSLCGIFAALLTICSWISIPVGGISFTMQTFALYLALLTLGAKRAFFSTLVWLLLGVTGIPVFSGFRGGISALLGPTGGFLWGFLAAAAIFHLLEKRPVIAAIGSMAVCYACGAAWLAWGYAEGAGIGVALIQCVLPCLAPDAGKIFLAFVLSRRLRRFAADN